jgi:hypothetical protein
MKKSWVALALVIASCRPPQPNAASTNVELPDPSAGALAGSSKAAPRAHAGCRTVATDIWGTNGRADASMSTSVRFDGSGRVLFALEKRRVMSEPVTVRSDFVWSRDGELVSIESVTVRGSAESREHDAFKYGAHHELLEVTIDPPPTTGGKQATFEWNGTFDAAPKQSPAPPPALVIPGPYRDLPSSLLAPTTGDPMPPLSFTGTVTISRDGGTDLDIARNLYERGLLAVSFDAGGREYKDGFDSDGRLTASAGRASTSSFTWDRGRVVREVIVGAEYRDEVSYEYDAHGKLMRQHMVDSEGKPVADMTWSDACPSE